MALQTLTCANCTAPLEAAESPPGVLVCAYCGRAHRFAQPPPPPAVHRHPIGSAVVVQWGAQWWDAHVIETPAPNVWKVHYDGWSDQWDELVGPDRIRDRSAAAGLTRGTKPKAVAVTVALSLLLVACTLSFVAMSALRSSPAPAPAAQGSSGVVAGAIVEVQWRGTWYRAQILEVMPDGSMRVHYEGYGPEHDEVVRPRRVRQPQ
jgi:hypothetical protein